MVRVTRPPGGAPKLETVPAETVRVLKPPGGGSSISFGLEEPTVTATASKLISKTSPFATDEDAGAAASVPAASEPILTENSPAESIPEAAAPDSAASVSVDPDASTERKEETSESNGTEVVNIKTNDSNTNDDFPSISFDKTSGNASPSAAVVQDKQQQSNVTSLPKAAENAQEHQPETSNKSVDESFPPVMASKTDDVTPVIFADCREKKNVVNGHSNDTVTANGDHDGTNVDVIPSETNGNHKETNGTPVSPSCVEPLSPEVVESTALPAVKSESTTTPQAVNAESATTPPPKAERSNSISKAAVFSRQSSEETRLYGNRVMPNNHHMKSSICMVQDENLPFFVPPRRSEAASVKDKASPPKQAPFLRVRQPPGGFSTQLW